MVDKQQSTIRAILRNEITWVVTFVGITIGFFNMVVIPLNRVQLQLTQIQADLADTKNNYESALTEHQSLRSRVDVLETKVSHQQKQNGIQN